MNQEQRKFLIDRVSNTHSKQVQELNKDMPIKPSLNNYLVAACLDNTLQLVDAEELRQKIRESVLKFGKNDMLVKEEDNDYYSRRSRTKKAEVTVEAEDIFIIPEAYKIALAEYNKKKSEVEQKVKLLDSQKETIILKIQIGSNKTLDKLVEQADNLADLNILNSQLLLQSSE